MQETYAQINSLRLCIASWGDGPAVVVSHGWCDHAGSWNQFATHMAAAGYKVIIPDQRGFGKSEHCPQSSHYHFPDYVADLAAVIQHFQLDKYVLIGHSMGGTVTTLLTALHSHPPQRLLLIDGLGPQSESPELARARYQQHLLSRQNPRKHTPMKSLHIAAEKFRRMNPYLSLRESTALISRVVYSKENEFYWRWDSRHREKAAISFCAQRHQQILAAIKCPTHLIFGSTSWYHHLPDLDARKDAIEAPCETHWLDSGHSPHLECPHALATLVLSVLA